MARRLQTVEEQLELLMANNWIMPAKRTDNKGTADIGEGNLTPVNSSVNGFTNGSADGFIIPSKTGLSYIETLTLFPALLQQVNDLAKAMGEVVSYLDAIQSGLMTVAGEGSSATLTASIIAKAGEWAANSSTSNSALNALEKSIEALAKELP